MSDARVELHRIHWSQVFPFVRLFRTLRLALDFKRLMLALLAVLLTYVVGSCLDSIWSARGVAHRIEDGVFTNEIQAYATLPPGAFNAWQHAMREEREAAALTAVTVAGQKITPEELARKLETTTVEQLAMTDNDAEALAGLRKFVRDRMEAGIAALDRDPNLPAGERNDLEQALTVAAGRLLIVLHEQPARGVPRGDLASDVAVIVGARPELPPDVRRDREDQLRLAVVRQAALHRYQALQPRGPFLSMLTFQMDCFASAVRGAAAGRWGIAEHAYAAEPSLGGSVLTGLRGAWWLVQHRFWYTLIFGLLALAIWSLFGGAICRSVAVQSAREENITMREALGFAGEKFTSFALAPLMPLVLMALLAILLWIGGLIMAIPNLEFIPAVLYGLTLVGGLVLALVLFALLFGFHLMWPTIAVEGSDGFDALSRTGSYLSSRIWHVLFYSGVLLVYGALSFLLIRLIAMLTLKFAHTCTKYAANLDGASEVPGLGKFDAMWQMPAWTELWTLPAANAMPFWGTFGNVPLDFSEGFAAWLLRVWVYLVVGLVSAFVISFFLAGSTQMYYLLRRDVDATDYDEVYYEEPELDHLGAGAAVPPATSVPPADASSSSAGPGVS